MTDLKENLLKKLIEEKKLLVSKTYNTDVDVEGDEIDKIQGSVISSIASIISSRDALKLRQIDNAIKKIEDNTFGVCEDCEELISDKRLEINPYFSKCISCAEKNEFESKQRRRV